MTALQSFSLVACLLAASVAHASTVQPQPGYLVVDSDAVLPNSPWKERGMPDAGTFNPAAGVQEAPTAAEAPAVVAPAAMTYYPPAILIQDRPRKPYALVAAPTLPCAPAYCPRRVARADRN
ncbi:MAG: hypothetical protein Q4G71_08615 [Pseudomonadota bacterium]|nr:hypothetical protein [Pseudomonadota bacterium]